MMLKITEGSDSDGKPTLYLEGQVTRAWLAEVSGCCERVLATARRLTLDLAEVSFVDRDAISFFKELTEREVVLTNCSPFVAEQLKGIGPCLSIEMANRNS
jgi:hypothetical protein